MRVCPGTATRPPQRAPLTARSHGSRPPSHPHPPPCPTAQDLESCKLSEVPWSGSGKERFFFDNAQVCLIYNAGELSLVEYGRNEVLGTCRTEYMSPFLISVRLNEGRNDIQENKKIAYLIDVQTVRTRERKSPSARARTLRRVGIGQTAGCLEGYRRGRIC